MESNFTGTICENIFEDNKEKVLCISKALSHPIRIDILHQLFSAPKSITELAKLNNITNATVIFHLEILEKATLVYSKTMPSKKGKTLIFFINFSSINLYTKDEKETKIDICTQSVGVGNFIDAMFEKYMRLATKTESFILNNDDVFDTRRFDAQMLCADNGYIKYAFSNSFAKSNKVEKLEISFEICSEAPYYRNDWKSEISMSVNGIELATYLSTGDFGGKRGELNPEWWENKFTQYGLLVNLTATEEGIFLNGEKVPSAQTINTLSIDKGNKIEFCIYTKKNAKYAGGFNLFGKGFGNYPQDIVMKGFCVKT